MSDPERAAACAVLVHGATPAELRARALWCMERATTREARTRLAALARIAGRLCYPGAA